VLHYHDRKIVAPIENASLPCATLPSESIVLNYNVLELIPIDHPTLLECQWSDQEWVASLRCTLVKLDCNFQKKHLFCLDFTLENKA